MSLPCKTSPRWCLEPQFASVGAPLAVRVSPAAAVELERRDGVLPHAALVCRWRRPGHRTRAASVDARAAHSYRAAPPMPKRKRSATTPSPRVLIALAVGALLCFLAGETWFLLSTDAGRLMLARFGLGDRARVTQIIGRHAHEALRLAGVPADSVRESVATRGAAAVKWHVGIKPEDSTLQTHYALAEELARCGASVLSGHESLGAHGESVVTLLVGVGDRATHEITIVRAVRQLQGGEPPAGKLALVLYGFGDDLDAARAFMAIGAPFAVAVVPGGKTSDGEFKAAHSAQREVVLHLPLEPINYPQVDPGPATIL